MLDQRLDRLGYHRGTISSARPNGPGRIGLADQVEGALAVPANTGVDHTSPLDWSGGAMLDAPPLTTGSRTRA